MLERLIDMLKFLVFCIAAPVVCVASIFPDSGETVVLQKRRELSQLIARVSSGEPLDFRAQRELCLLDNQSIDKKFFFSINYRDRQIQTLRAAIKNSNECSKKQKERFLKMTTVAVGLNCWRELLSFGNDAPEVVFLPTEAWAPSFTGGDAKKIKDDIDACRNSAESYIDVLAS